MLLRLLDTPNLVTVDGMEGGLRFLFGGGGGSQRGKHAGDDEAATGGSRPREDGGRKKSGAAVQHIRGVGDGFDTFTNFPLVSLFLFVVFHGAE